MNAATVARKLTFALAAALVEGAGTAGESLLVAERGPRADSRPWRPAAIGIESK